MRDTNDLNFQIYRVHQALIQTNGNRGAAARLLGIDRTTLYRIAKEYDFRVEKEVEQDRQVATASTKAQPDTADGVSVQPLSTSKKSKAWMIAYIKHEKEKK